MSHAEICPICRGKGTNRDDNASTPYTYPCHGCGGRGWITVIDPLYVYVPSSYRDLMDTKFRR